MFGGLETSAQERERQRIASDGFGIVFWKVFLDRSQNFKVSDSKVCLCVSGGSVFGMTLYVSNKTSVCTKVDETNVFPQTK